VYKKIQNVDFSKILCVCKAPGKDRIAAEMLEGKGATLKKAILILLCSISV